MIESNGMNGSMEPAPVSGASRYSHLVSTAPATSVSRSNPVVVPGNPAPGPVPCPMPPAELAVGPMKPLVKSNSTAQTPLALPISPVSVKTPRSREYHPRSRPPSVTSRSGQLLYADVTKSTSPLIVTLGIGAAAGAGCCASTGGLKTPRMATAESRRTTTLLMTASSMWWVRCPKTPITVQHQHLHTLQE